MAKERPYQSIHQLLITRTLSFNPMNFTADGSSATIRAVITACGID